VPEGLRPGSIRRAGRAWQPRSRPATRPLPTPGAPGRVGRLRGDRRLFMPRGIDKVLARRRAPSRIQVLVRRARAPAQAQPRMLMLTRVLPVGLTITHFSAPPGPSAPTGTAIPLPMAHVAARLERIALTSTVRVESSGPLGLPAIPPPAAPGTRGETGPAQDRRPALVLRSSPPPAAAPARPEPSSTATGDAPSAVRPADGPAVVPPLMPSIDEITTQVIRRIERRATAQRERLARPPRS
jgi:hypothetical protein